MDGKDWLTCKQIGLKPNNIKEMYWFLASDRNVYLPPIKEAN